MSARQSPPCNSGGAWGQLQWPKKPDRCLIRCARMCRSCWGGVFAKAGDCLTTMSFFLQPFISLSWALIFMSGLLKFIFVLHFIFVLDLVLILLIYIYIFFNASWSLFFSISSLSSFNLICFLYPIWFLFFWLLFFYSLHFFIFFILSFRILIHFFQILVLIVFFTLLLSFSSFICFSQFNPWLVYFNYFLCKIWSSLFFYF